MKAILIAEMPDCCGNCQFCGQMYNDEFEDWKYWCNAKDKEIPETNDKQKWCPLKPLPKRKATEYKWFTDKDYPTGWNDCLKEIIGEKE